MNPYTISVANVDTSQTRLYYLGTGETLGGRALPQLVEENRQMGKYSDFLFAQPSFVEGMARILDFGDSLTEFNRSSRPDTIAIRADWRAVYNDLAKAFDKVAEDIGAEDVDDIPSSR